MQPLGGAPESALDGPAAAGLPATAPAAPWTCRCDAIVWFARPPSTRRLAAGAGGQLPGRPLLVAGALISYADSPVGPYHEVLGLLAGFDRRGPVATVPFIAVDSAASLVGGRQNWALPKAFAHFHGGSMAAAGGGPMTAAGAGWTVTATATAGGPAVPVRLAGRLRQRWPDGGWRSAGLAGRARAHPALVRVTVASAGPLAGWLRPGRHPGMLLRQAEFSLAAPDG
ncbi:MAG TPA: acetoacetate decarboxylase family protein [Jatrophihabitans sp.]|nr:acetoacetate decarboxylase family protein [Jatrophihabitans sp.]